MLSTSLSIFVFMLTISTNNLVDFFFYIFHTSLTAPLFFIEVSVSSQESEWASIMCKGIDFDPFYDFDN
jgi:hypothetical protein